MSHFLCVLHEKSLLTQSHKDFLLQRFTRSAPHPPGTHTLALCWVCLGLSPGAECLQRRRRGPASLSTPTPAPGKREAACGDPQRMGRIRGGVASRGSRGQEHGSLPVQSGWSPSKTNSGGAWESVL